MGERGDGIGTTKRSSSVSKDSANIKKALANPSSSDLDQFMVHIIKKGIYIYIFIKILTNFIL